MLSEAELLDTQKIAEEYYAVLRASKAAHVPLADPQAEARYQQNVKAAFDRANRIMRNALPRELKAVRLKDFKRRSDWRGHLSKVQAEREGEFYAD